MSIAGDLLTDCAVLSIKAAQPLLRLSYGTWEAGPMLRERPKMRTTEAESIKAIFSGESGCSSEKASVIEVERRAGVKLPSLLT